jgi:PEP-CTERM motif
MIGGTIQVDLVNSSQTGSPGDTLQFFGTITNLSATDTVFFNGASSTSVSGDLTIDLTPYLLNAPLSLGPGEVSTLFDIFDIAVDPAALPGPYIGNTVSILGGADSNAFDDILDINADVTVASSSVPEPASAALLLAGLGLIVRLSRQKSSDRN